MSGVAITPTPPAPDTRVFIAGVFQALARGGRVFIIAKPSLVEKLKPLLDELGIQLVELGDDAKLPDDCVVIRQEGGIRLKIEVYERGAIVKSVTTTLSVLESVLAEVKSKLKGAPSQTPPPEPAGRGEPVVIQLPQQEGGKPAGESDKAGRKVVRFEMKVPDEVRERILKGVTDRDRGG